ncbi:MAG: peptidoglycan DD-metalloendopeptidase family protein [Oscillospiraceae bacterium]|nr:peptidoglycan DD-metalloendopeptidase family protein [Oscillospiraceae bacterium]
MLTITKKRVTAFLLAILMTAAVAAAGLVPGTRALAVSQAEIDELKEEADSLAAQKAEVQKKINALEADKDETLAKKAALDEQIMLTEQEIANLEAQIEVYHQLIHQKELEVEAAQKAEDEQLQKYRERVQSMEENGNISYLAVLFEADSFSDFLSRLDFVHEVMIYDEQLYNDYIAAKEATIRAKEALEEALAQEEAAKALEEEKKAELEEQVRQAEAYVAELQNNIDTQAAYYAQVDAAEAELNATIRQKEAELAEQRRLEEERRKREEEAARQAAAASGSSSSSSGSSSSSSGVTGTGSFSWPTPSCWGITSDYGYRVHPITGAYRLHAGIDIGAVYGAQILAADSGTVTASYYHWSYGNMVMISHGNGYTTLYAHMSSFAVSTGQSVSKGQVIGYVGSTGQSTAAHCHFEIRYNGNYCDPKDYFSGYFFY